MEMEMLFKVFGCLLILCSSSAIGITYSQEIKKRLQELEELKALFCIMKSELDYQKVPFLQLFESVEARVVYPFDYWLRDLRQRLEKRSEGTFFEIWSDSIYKNLRESSLKAEDLEELKGIGRNLEYLENIDVYIERLEYRIENVRKIYLSKKRLSRSLGIMGGVFLIILFL